MDQIQPKIKRKNLIREYLATLDQETLPKEKNINKILIISHAANLHILEQYKLWHDLSEIRINSLKFLPKKFRSWLRGY